MRSANVVFPDPEFPKIATFCIGGYRGAKRDRDKPQQGVVPSTLNLHRNGAVGFIDWLDVSSNRDWHVDQQQILRRTLSMRVSLCQSPP